MYSPCCKEPLGEIKDGYGHITYECSDCGEQYSESELPATIEEDEEMHDE